MLYKINPQIMQKLINLNYSADVNSATKIHNIGGAYKKSYILKQVANILKNEFHILKIYQIFNDACSNQDYDLLNLLKKFKLKIPNNGNFLIDQAFFKKDYNLAFFLISEFKCTPSKHAYEYFKKENPLLFEFYKDNLRHRFK